MHKLLKIFLFAVLFMAVSATASLTVFQVSAPIVERLMEADTRKQSELWHRRVILHLNDPDATFLTQNLTEEDTQYLSLLPEASNIYRFSLYNADGTIIWSTRPEEIGSSAPAHYPGADIAAGKVAYNREQKPAAEIDGLALHALRQDVSIHEIAKVFEPVISDGKVVGAIEFYTDITDLRASFLMRVQVLLAALTAIALLTVGVVATILYRTNRHQYLAMMQKADTEKTLMSEQLRLARDVKLLGELNEWLQSSRSLEELFDMVGRFLTHILPRAEGSVYVYSNSRDVLDGWASWNGGTHKDHIHPEECWGLRRGRTYEYGANEINFKCGHVDADNNNPYFCFPLLAHGETVGLLHLHSKTTCAETFFADRGLAQMCAEQISMAIANVRMRDELHDQSVRDPLTGLFNRRHMTESLRKLINDSERSGASFAVVAIDVDHFKKFNDTHGHDAGDMVLRAVGSAMEQDCDGDDVACRPGGEEFTVILPDCDMQTGMDRAEALRRKVENIKVRYGEKTLPKITISIGVATYPANGTLPQFLLRAADEALYQAKSLGRNRVVLADNLQDTDPMLDGMKDAPNDWALPAPDEAETKKKTG